METTVPDPAKHPRAFLWISPTCDRVRAVVFGQHNIIEEGIFDHPVFRHAMADLGFAIVWVTPSFDAVFCFDEGAGDRVNALMKTLAAESGCQEIEFAPIVPIGHSAHASYPWNFAAWNPKRTLAVLSVKGDAPLTNRTGSGKPNPDWGERNIDGVPGLMVMGEYEWLQDRLDPAIAFRKQHPATPLSVLADVGHGHFDYSDQLISYLVLFLRKAALHRLPDEVPLDGSVDLKPVDVRQGWLVDQWRKGEPLQAAASPFAEYKGDRGQAFWCFDKEIALATEHFNDQCGRLPQLLGYEQEGQVPGQSKTHQQVTLKFLPLSDGISFRLKGVFLDTVPDVPVHYYVREGPAEIEGDTLKFTAIPPRAKYPVKVTVIAWQWGRSIEPKLKTAEPVERTFNIVK
jgi:hypothetical protein